MRELSLIHEDLLDYRWASKLLRLHVEEGDVKSLLVKDELPAPCDGWKIVFDKSKSLFSVCLRQFISFLLCLPWTNIYTPFSFNHDWWSERKCLVEKIWSRINSLMFDWDSLHRFSIISIGEGGERNFLIIKSKRNLFPLFFARKSCLPKTNKKLDSPGDRMPTRHGIRSIEWNGFWWRVK